MYLFPLFKQGAIGGLLGMNGGASGSGFAGPTGTNGPQLQTAYTQQQQALAQQQAFANAVGANNGLANQASVYGQQQGLANQLQGVANGTGPNPAAAQLAQATGANVANQSALMAGQRGSSANVGLMARQAANTGANIQQQAAGQGATMQAQQSLAAMQQLQNQQASMGNMANQQIGQQQSANQAQAQTALTGQQNLLSMQGNINAQNAGLAGASQGAQSSALGGLMGSAGGALSGLLGGGSASPLASAGDYTSLPEFGGALPASTEVAGGAGDAISGASDIASVAAKGGKVSDLPKKRMAEGGETSDPLMQATPAQQVAAPTVIPASAGPQSTLGKQLTIQQNSGVSKATGSSSSGGAGALGAGAAGAVGAAGSAVGSVLPAIGKGASWAWKEMNPVLGMSGVVGHFIGDNILKNLADGGEVNKMASGGKVPALVSPGEQYLKPQDVQKVKAGANPLAVGERIPGKPKFKGNNYANDTVPKTLDEGGIVIPNKVMQSKNPHSEAMKFVHATMAKSGKRSKT